ncbi:excalibur calcium-binding domain-containing protein [Actinomadura bangladeshensis]|uniref:Excalibur calcium-binding domain-containing protein n=1 Tax=Actinomadura bangladeshensis TaxID=453573 RepID=A0A6L9QPW8_9ACTN|nr:excalibur calcium-binding domain-containing protein [Actinomadura bangladeshensis]
MDCEPLNTAAPTSPEPSGEGGLDPRFATCAKANAAGYGPYVKGVDPEYAWYEDRDQDGIDCEPRSGGGPSSPIPSTSTPSEEPSTSGPGEMPSDSGPSEEPSEPGSSSGP